MKKLLFVSALLFQASSFATSTRAEVGYLEYNGRCPSFGVAFHFNEDEEAPSGICAIFTPLESLKIPDDAKREAIRVMIDKKVLVMFNNTGSGTISVSEVELLEN